MDSKNTVTPSARLRIPHQNLEALSFCPSTPEGVTQWAEQLPVGDIAVLAHTVNQCLQEIIRLNTTTTNRLNLLNAVTPQCHHIFLKTSQQLKLQPVSLPPEVKSLASMCQQIQMNLSQGYIAVAMQTKPSHLLSLSFNKQELPEDTVSIAIYSALLQLHYCQISAYQAGMAAPKDFWLRVHQLYVLASQWKLLAFTPTKMTMGALNAPSVSIEQLYLGALLLGASQHYQLRAADIPTLAAFLLSWSLHTELNEEEGTHTIVVTQNQDSAPVSQQFASKENIEECLYLHLDSILKELEVSHNNGSPIVVDGKNTPDYLIKHLVLVWGSDIDRVFPRLESKQHLDITIGFSNIHYHVGGGRPFSLYAGDHDDLLLKKEDKRPQGKTHAVNSDPWDNPFKMHLDEEFNTNFFTSTVKSNIKKNDAALIHSEDEKHPIYAITTLDMSPGGYRAEWPGDTPSTLKPGELLGYREGHHSRWGIAVIRWVRLQDDGKTHFGIEVLATSTLPYAAMTSTSLDGVPYRAFLLPEIKLINQPPALIAPQMAFKSKQRLFLLNHDGTHHTIP